MIGKMLGNYRVVSQLGAGGMGAVWIGEHKLLGSRAAIKVLLPDLSAQPAMVQRFFDEARAATRIQDPGIVSVVDFGWDDGNAYLVMELLVGESLHARLRRVDRLIAQQAVRVIQQCAITMAAAHARGIVHRDLKPDNIYLVADAAVPGGERTKILDFGIAKLVDRATSPGEWRTQSGAILGTPAYMSPEQCRAAGEVDHRTDIYALGCVLFHALCGRPPFIAPTAGDMIAAHLRERAPRASEHARDVPRDVEALVARCLEKEPDRRFASMTELARAAVAITGDQVTIPALAAPGAPSRPVVDGTAPTAANTTLGTGAGQVAVTQPPRSRRAQVVAGVLLVAGVAAAGVVFAVTRSGASDHPAPAPPDARNAAPLAQAIDAAPPPIDAALADAPPTTLPPPAPPPSRPRRPQPRDAGVLPLAADARTGYEFR